MEKTNPKFNWELTIGAKNFWILRLTFNSDLVLGSVLVNFLIDVLMCYLINDVNKCTLFEIYN